MHPLDPTLGPGQESPLPTAPPTLATLLWLFLKLGAIGFGGGIAVIALLEHELVHRRGLLDLDTFLHGVSLGQILGSSATNTAFFLGYRLFGFSGGLACATAFMTPSVALVILLARLYFRFHAIPSLQMVMLGLGPVVIALILSAAWSMGRQAIRSWPAGLLAAVAMILTLLKLTSLVALGAGALAGLWLGKDVLAGTASLSPKRKLQGLVALGALPLAPSPLAPSLAVTAWTFLKVGFLFFGGGFVLVPVLHHLLVDSYAWLSTREFLDGVAISNLTPGPIAVLATFAGYRVQGIPGALLATLVLFAPSLLLMGVLSRFYTRMQHLRRAQDLLAGLSPTMVGLILGAGLLLAPGAVHDLSGCLLFGAALALLVRFDWHPAFVIGLGALAGMAGWVR